MEASIDDDNANWEIVDINGSNAINNTNSQVSNNNNNNGNGNSNNSNDDNLVMDSPNDRKSYSPNDGGDRRRNENRSRSRSKDRYHRRSGGSGGGGSQHRSRSRSRSPRRNNNRDGSRERGGGGAGYRRTDMNNRRSNNNNHNNSGGPTDKELGLKYRWDRTIYISNIAYDVRWTELKDLFRSKVADDIVYCEIFEKDGRSMGVGSMEFKTMNDAERAVEIMNQYELNGRKIAVRLDQEGFKTRQAKEIAGDYRHNNNNNNNKNNNNYNNNNSNNNSNNNNKNYSSYSNSYSNGNSSSSSNSNSTNLLSLLGLNNSMMSNGMNPLSSNNVGLTNLYGGSNPTMAQTNLLNQLAAQLKVDGPVTNRIFVASLDYKVDEKKLREVFSLAGNVVSVSLFRDRDNRSRGMAVIEYETPLEALNAVSMFHTQQLLDRQMTVRFDTKPPKEEDNKPSSNNSSSKLPSGLKSIGSGITNFLQQQVIPSPVQSSSQSNSYNPLASLSNMNSSMSNSNTPDLSTLANLAGLTTSNLNSILKNLGINTTSTSSSNLSNGQSNQSNPPSLMNFSATPNSLNNNNNLPSYKSVQSYNTIGNGQSSSNRISKIFVKNIPFSWDDRKLKEKFRQAGNIEYAEVKMRDGKSKGCGLIQFADPDQASKAVELFNGSRFEGRTLEVKIDQMP